MDKKRPALRPAPDRLGDRPGCVREPKTPATAAGLERVQQLEKAIDDLQKAQETLQAVGGAGED